MSTDDLTRAEVVTLSGQTSGVIPQSISSQLEEISPWWLRGTAIALILLTTLGLLNVLIAEIAIGFTSESLQTIEPDIGPFPENGSASEQRQWNETNDALIWMDATQQMLDDPRMLQLLRVQRIGTILSFFVAAVSVFFLLNQDRKGLGFAGLWIGIGLIVQLYIAFISSILSSEYFGELYDDELAWVLVAQTYGGYVQVAMCNLSFLAILIIVWTRTRVSPVIIKSAFHNLLENNNDYHR